MSTDYQISAQIRDSKGTAHSRKYRRTGKVPAVIYGAGKENQHLLLEHNEIMHSLSNEAFSSAILDIKVEGDSQQAILRNVQMHPYKSQVMHVDFQRVSAKEKLHMAVPIHFVGEDEAPGIVNQGGIVSHLMNEVDIECLPKDLPEYLEIDMSALEMHDSVKLSDIKLPEGVEITVLARGGEDQAVGGIVAPQVEVEEPVEGEEEEALEGEEALDQPADADASEDDAKDE